MNYLLFLGFGALGGLARGFVGVIKHFKTSEYIEFIDYQKVLFNILGACVIGAVVGIIVDTNPILALTSGYAGIDIIESVIKISKK